MPWKEISVDELAKELGVNIEEIREKHKLIDKIIKERKKQNLSQEKLGKLIGVSQSRIARIESGIGTKNMSFDLLFKILLALGINYRITTHRISKKEKRAA